ncbi:MAG: MFS transporter, partial [Actinobacteria bacterium]|nr:MFS transporter [Actinomycetota bacterium]
PRVMVLGGTVATAAAAAALVGLEPTSSYPLVLVPCLVGLGAGVGTTFVATAALSMTDVPEEDAGIAAGLLSTFQAVGGSIGVAVVASLAAARTDRLLDAADRPPTPAAVGEALMSGFGRGFTVTAVLAAAAVVAAAVTAPGRAPGPRGDAA